MSSSELMPLFATNRYSSISGGKLAQNATSDLPGVSKKSSMNHPISMHEIMTNSSIDRKLKSISHISENKSNLKFLKYKFNPNEEENH